MAERTVGIIGLGLIGGSLARALVARGVRVLGTARDAADRHLAARCGVEVVDDAARLAAAVPPGGAVVLAVPLGVLGTVADALLPGLAPGVVVLHAAGLQRPEATGLAAGGRVLGTHPLAGSHAGGFEASRADLFAGATVWAEARADAGARACLEWLWAGVGARAVEYRTAEAHDATVAWVSHLPQLASTALAAALAGAGVPASLGGPGLRDATRLAASPLPVWRDVLRAAPPETDAALAALADAIAQLRVALARDDADGVAEVWERARAWRGAPAPRNPEPVEEPPVTERIALSTGSARW